mgnify:CR=1 FL=1|jgi:hypothetical protein
MYSSPHPPLSAAATRRKNPQMEISGKTGDESRAPRYETERGGGASAYSIVKKP